MNGKETKAMAIVKVIPAQCKESTLIKRIV